MAEKSDKITFKYLFPSDLRDLYVNGLWGGVSSRGELYVHFYSERYPIPNSATHKLNDQGLPGIEASIDMPGDIVRLIQCTITFDMATAVAFRDWLNERIGYLAALKEGQISNPGTIQ